MTNRILDGLVGGALALAVGILISAAFADRAYAHGGGKDKFGGHVEKATGLYHCHTKKAPQAQSELCEIVARGKNAGAMERRVKAAQEALGRAEVAASIAQEERNAILAENTRIQREAQKNVADARAERDRVKNRYQVLITEAEKERNLAAVERLEAKAAMAEAIRREKGAGPSSSRTCRHTLNELVIEAETSWLRDSVSLDPDERRRIDLACIR